jgi:4-amino-4-deoxy-L-arabinose transferase-like glycosyltransferase
MDEFDEFSEHRSARMPGERLGEWVRENRILIMYGILLITVMFSRGFWGSDERRMADLTHDLFARRQWLPSASAAASPGAPTILYLWLTKLSVSLGALIGGLASEPSAWPLRAPSVLGSITFLYFFRTWASRFLQRDVADLAMLILCATPLWFWQSQAIQVDLLFSAMLGASWLCWLAGYLLLRRSLDGAEDEYQSWFRWSYFWLGLAFLVKGPVPLMLSALLLILFLMWQKDFQALKETALNPAFAILLILVSAGYASGMVAVPGFHALWQGFSRVQPVWIYVVYLFRDLFPWVVLLPTLVVFLRGSGAHKAPTVRFLMIAFLVPFSISLWGDGVQGTDPLVAYPFLALLLAGLLQPIYVEGVSAARIRSIGALLAATLWIASLSFFLVSVIRLGGPAIQGLVLPMFGSLRLATLVLVMGALSVSIRCAKGEGEFLVRETTATVCVVLFIIGTWGFQRLDPVLQNWNHLTER